MLVAYDATLRLPDSGPRHSFKTDFLIFEVLAVVFATEMERVRLGGYAVPDAGDDVRATHPVRFGQVGLRPASRMVRMRMVEADDVLRAPACLALDAHQLARVNLVPVVQCVGALVIATRDCLHVLQAIALDLPQQNAATLMWVTLFAVTAKLLPFRFADPQCHGYSELSHISAGGATWWKRRASFRPVPGSLYLFGSV